MSVPSWGAIRVGIATAGWPLRGGRGTTLQKNKNTKKIYKKEKKINSNYMVGCSSVDARFYFILKSHHLYICKKHFSLFNEE